MLSMAASFFRRMRQTTRDVAPCRGIGKFLEHGPQTALTILDAAKKAGNKKRAKLAYSCPCGPFAPCG